MVWYGMHLKNWQVFSLKQKKTRLLSLTPMMNNSKSLLKLVFARSSVLFFDPFLRRCGGTGGRIIFIPAGAIRTCHPWGPMLRGIASVLRQWRWRSLQGSLCCVPLEALRFLVEPFLGTVSIFLLEFSPVVACLDKNTPPPQTKTVFAQVPLCKSFQLRTLENKKLWSYQRGVRCKHLREGVFFSEKFAVNF